MYYVTSEYICKSNFESGIPNPMKTSIVYPHNAPNSFGHTGLNIFNWLRVSTQIYF